MAMNPPLSPEALALADEVLAHHPPHPDPWIDWTATARTLAQAVKTQAARIAELEAMCSAENWKKDDYIRELVRRPTCEDFELEVGEMRVRAEAAEAKIREMEARQIPEGCVAHCGMCQLQQTGIDFDGELDAMAMQYDQWATCTETDCPLRTHPTPETMAMTTIGLTETEIAARLAKEVDDLYRHWVFAVENIQSFGQFAAPALLSHIALANPENILRLAAANKVLAADIQRLRSASKNALGSVQDLKLARLLDHAIDVSRLSTPEDKSGGPSRSLTENDDG